MVFLLPESWDRQAPTPSALAGVRLICERVNPLRCLYLARLVLKVCEIGRMMFAENIESPIDIGIDTASAFLADIQPSVPPNAAEMRRLPYKLGRYLVII